MMGDEEWVEAIPPPTTDEHGVTTQRGSGRWKRRKEPLENPYEPPEEPPPGYPAD